MNKFPAIALCCLLSPASFAANVGEQSGVNSAVGAAPTTRDFVQQAAVSDLFEIKASQLAASRLKGKDKDFADQMVADHTKTSAQLSQQAKADNFALPTALDATHQGLMDRLQGFNNIVALRKEYLSGQIQAHEQAVSLFSRYAQGGDDAKLKSWAAATLPVLKHHLDMAKGLENSR